jgi:hypothetical protein
MSSLAASYASLSLQPTWLEIAAVLAGLALCSAVAVLWVARRATRETVVSGLGAR